MRLLNENSVGTTGLRKQKDKPSSVTIGFILESIGSVLNVVSIAARSQRNEILIDSVTTPARLLRTLRIPVDT